MFNLLSNVAILSIDVTRVLVVSLGMGLGYDTAAAASTNSRVGRFTATIDPTTSLPYPPLGIVGCTGAGAPIVITTAYPHGVSSRGVGGMSCIIQGIGGNLAANHLDVDPRSRTIGLPAGVLAKPTGATTLALYGQDPLSGALVPLMGSGTYTSGGTVTPAFTDGSILLGRDTARENSAAPRIIMIPRTSKWGPRSNSIPFDRAAERRAQKSQRSIRTEWVVFDVMCWGQDTPPNPARDYDVVRSLAHAVVDSAHLLFGVTDMLADGVWNDEAERRTQQIKAGHLFTFGLGIAMPVLDNALPYVPPTAEFNSTTETQTPDGVIETGCTG